MRSMPVRKGGRIVHHQQDRLTGLTVFTRVLKRLFQSFEFPVIAIFSRVFHIVRVLRRDMTHCSGYDDAIERDTVAF